MAYPKELSALYERLIKLPLDRLEEEPVPSYRFEARLRGEHGWNHATAMRVTAEYRRFLHLAALGGASPSEKVDAAWHLHLTYSKAYRIGLCERTLGRPLDHTPSTGRADTGSYIDLYRNTLERYRETFGAEPPADIWPQASGVAASKRAHGFATGWFVWTCAGLLLVGWAASVGPGFAVFLFFGFIVCTLLLAITDVHAAHRGKKSGGGSCGGGGGGSGDGAGGDGGSGCGGGCGGGGCGG